MPHSILTQQRKYECSWSAVLILFFQKLSCYVFYCRRVDSGDYSELTIGPLHERTKGQLFDLCHCVCVVLAKIAPRCITHTRTCTVLGLGRQNALPQPPEPVTPNAVQAPYSLPNSYNLLCGSRLNSKKLFSTNKIYPAKCIIHLYTWCHHKLNIYSRRHVLPDSSRIADIFSNTQGGTVGLYVKRTPLNKVTPVRFLARAIYLS